MSKESTPEQGASTPQGREIRELDAGALRALAHPLRVEIYDTLSQYGPQTASSLAARLGELKELRAITADGVSIELTANIEFPHEAETCLEFGADGIGGNGRHNRAINTAR